MLAGLFVFDQISRSGRFLVAVSRRCLAKTDSSNQAARAHFLFRESPRRISSPRVAVTAFTTLGRQVSMLVGLLFFTGCFVKAYAGFSDCPKYLLASDVWGLRAPHIKPAALAAAG